jgi:hypothetical protein
MNERIKQLAEQAGLQPFEDCGPKYVYKMEKFAELIVQECAEICRRQQYYDADDEHKRGVNSGSYTCMNAIKQQFGVEE